MFNETQISKAIACSYHEKMLERVTSDVLIVGAGPAGLMAGYYLARAGRRVTIVETSVSRRRHLGWRYGS